MDISTMLACLSEMPLNPDELWSNKYMREIFCEKVFFALAGLDLEDYVDRVDASGMMGLNKELIGRIVIQSEEIDVLHCFYIARWGVILEMNGMIELIIKTLSRSDATGGEQMSLLRLLLTSNELRSEHVKQLERVTYRGPYCAFSQQIEIIKKHVEYTDTKS